MVLVGDRRGHGSRRRASLSFGLAVVVYAKWSNVPRKLERPESPAAEGLIDQALCVVSLPFSF